MLEVEYIWIIVFPNSDLTDGGTLTIKDQREINETTIEEEWIKTKHRPKYYYWINIHILQFYFDFLCWKY